MDGGVEDPAEDKGVMGEHGNAQQMAEPVLEGTGQIVLDLEIAEREDVPDRESRGDSVVRCEAAVAPDLLERGSAKDLLGEFGDVQGLEDKGTDFFQALEPVVLGPGQEEKPPGPGHPDIEETAFFLDITLLRRALILENLVGKGNLFPP